MVASFGQLVSAVNALLGLPNVGAILQLNNASRERAFEAYVFSLVLRAVQQAGGNVELRGVLSGANPTTVVFRGAPGHMGSRAQDFAFAYCQLNGKEFEVHLDVQYLGTSGAMHEIDVSIYEHDKADQVRARPGTLPTARPLLGALECKFYDSNLGTGLGRAFVGLVDDCGSLQVKCFVTNGTHPGLASYFSKGQRPQPFFNLSPLTAGHADRFVRDIEQALRKWARVG